MITSYMNVFRSLNRRKERRRKGGREGERKRRKMTATVFCQVLRSDEVQDNSASL
jgi:hypothetical protein